MQTSIYNSQTMDNLLIRNWFTTDDDILDVLDCAESWGHVYDNRFKYPLNVREIIEPYDYKNSLKTINLKVKELTNKEWDAIDRAIQLKNENEFEDDWAQYSETISDRTMGSVDTLLDDAWDNFCAAKDKLTKYLESKNKKYVAPSARTTKVDPKQQEIEDHIRAMENEYDEAQKAVESVESIYWENKKNDYRKTWMPKLQA
jgi:hypothetical protein